MVCRKKKGQVQTFETIAVLFIFFVLLMISVVFYIGYSRGRAQIDTRDFHEAQSVKVAQRVIDMPELQDTKKGIASVNCFDQYKIESLSKLNEEEEGLRLGIYQERFGVSTVIVHEIYPGNASWVLYNNTLPDYRFRSPFFIPKCIYDPLLGQRGYKVGLLEVDYYG